MEMGWATAEKAATSQQTALSRREFKAAIYI